MVFVEAKPGAEPPKRGDLLPCYHCGNELRLAWNAIDRCVHGVPVGEVCSDCREHENAERLVRIEEKLDRLLALHEGGE